MASPVPIFKPTTTSTPVSSDNGSLGGILSDILDFGGGALDLAGEAKRVFSEDAVGAQATLGFQPNESPAYFNTATASGSTQPQSGFIGNNQNLIIAIGAGLVALFGAILIIK
jgi:hypothetical protein